MPRSSQRHNREIYGVDSAGETPEQHGEIGNVPSPGGGETPPVGSIWFRNFSSGTLGADATFSRASVGTYIAGGVVNSAGIDEVRFQNDAVLVEPAATNTIIWSESLANWVNYAASSLEDQVNAPDGSLTADRIVETGANELQARYLNSGAHPNKIAISLFARTDPASAKRYVNFSCDKGLSYFAITFDTDTGLSTHNAQNGVTILAAEKVTLNDGWFRLNVVVEDWTGGGAYFYLGMSDIPVPTYGAYGIVSYTGDGASGVFYWGMQTTDEPRVSSYIPTAGAAATRAADVLSYSDVPTPNETRIIYNGMQEQDIDDWDGVVPALGDVEAISVWEPGLRPL